MRMLLAQMHLLVFYGLGLVRHGWPSQGQFRWLQCELAMPLLRSPSVGQQ